MRLDTRGILAVRQHREKLVIAQKIKSRKRKALNVEIVLKLNAFLVRSLQTL